MAKTKVEPLLARAAALRALARGFTYPDRGFQEELAQGKFRSETLTALEALGKSTSGVDPEAPLLEALPGAEAQPDSLEGEYTYLFFRNVIVPPYETSYAPQQSFRRVRELADIASFYAAFGFKVSPERGELPDHVGAELEFLSLLYIKEAYAREQGWRREARVCAQAREKFLREHLGGWMPAFAKKLQEQARLPFYPALALAADRVLSAEPAYLEAAALLK